LAVPAIAIGLCGCVGISAVGTSQPQSMGPLQLTVSACANGAPSCAATSNSGSLYEAIDASSAEVQVLVAVRLPVGSTAPENLLAGLGGGGSLSFARSPTYEAELQALEPAPTGERWWGWLSTAGTYSQSSKQSFTVTISATLPRPADGGPLESPMHWRPVVGGRAVDGGASAGRPVKCGTTNNDLYEGYSEGGGLVTVFCIDSPSADATRGFLTAPLIDFGIVGSSVQAPPGGTVTAVFVAKRSGAVDPAIFTLAAHSEIPGGTVTIDRTTVSLGGDATQPVLATIGVPANTAAGTYPVTLNATSPGKPDRSGTVTVTVPGPPADDRPSIRSASLSRKRFRTKPQRSKSGKAVPPKVGTKLKIDLSEKAELSIKVVKLGKREKALGTATRSLPSGKSLIGIRGRIGRVALGTGRHRITLTAEDAGGQRSAPTRLTFTVVG
jgi:hypothetical protein